MSQRLLTEQQSGHKGCSTVTMLLKLKDDILNAMKKKLVTPSLQGDCYKALSFAFCLIPLKKMH